MSQNEFKELIKNLEKNFGTENVIDFEKNKNKDIEVISTGSLIIDQLLGIGGFPKGRVIEIFGPESSGKTSLCLSLISEVNKLGKYASFIDVEHSLDIQHAKKLGVDLGKIIVSQPNSGEQAIEIAEHLIKSEKIDVIIIDSVAALIPNAELQGKIEDNTIGLQARLMSKSLRRLTSLMSKHNTMVVFINQIREKVGVIFGSNEVTPGGRALKFFSTIRLDLRIKERVKDGDEFIGQVIKVKVIKNKLAAPYKTDFIYFDYEKGIDKNLELLDVAVNKDIIDKKGSWYYFEKEKLGQGKKEAIKKIQELKLFDKIYEKIKIL